MHMVVDKRKATHNALQPSTRDYAWDLLLVMPVRLGDEGQGLLFEAQACNDIERWLENFKRIQVVCPVPKGPVARSRSVRRARV
jgi:hypothetical protein